MSLLPNKEYQQILNSLKEKIRLARYRSAIKLNHQLLSVYWEIGNTILLQQKQEGWGSKVTARLAKDLKMEFPDLRGLSERNLVYMQTFASSYPHFPFTQGSLAEIENDKNHTIAQVALAELQSNENQQLLIVQGTLAQLSWYHHITLLDKVKDLEQRLFYMQKAVENGWTRDVMVLQIDNKLHERQGKAITNFSTTLPAVYSDFATETLKSPYIIDFLSLTEEMKERDIENGLIQHMKKFMLELGRGFAYVGNQKNINVDGDDFFLDLLFFNYNLDCFVIFELKVGAFKPEFAGKLNFYVTTVNEQIKLPQHKPTIGVLLCKTPNKTVIEYSLKGIESPIGVANYELIKALPKELRGEIPSIEELEREIEGEYTELLKPVDKKIMQLNDLIKGLKQPHAKEIRSAINCERILIKVVFFLRNSIKKMLEEKEISKKFADLEIMVWTDSQGKKSDEEVKDYLKQRGEVGEFRIEIRLNGFMPAGTKAFNISKDLSIVTNSYNYTIGLDRYSQNTLLEKLYHQLPDKKEFENILDKWMEAIIDSITQNLELLKQSSK